MTSNIRILVAEDNEVNQHLIQRILSRLGYEPVLAKNGVQVLNKMDKQSFDLILMDIQMPEMDGITTTKLIRAHYESEKQPVIFALTAETATEGIEKYYSAGMNGILSKPIQIDQLVKVIDGVSSKANHTPVEIHSDNKAVALTSFSVLDADVIVEFMELMGDDGTDAAKHLIDLFFQGTPELIQKIETAYGQQDLAEVKKLVHTLKGSSSQIGAKRLEQFCVRLEGLLNQFGLEPFGTFITGIKQEFRMLEESLKDFLIRLNN